MARTLSDLADKLYSDKRAEVNSSLEPGHTTTVYGVASGTSEDGIVKVKLSDDATQADEFDGEDATYVELPTVVSVQDGDDVIVSLVGGDLKAPFVSGVIGEGDRILGRIDIADDHAAAAAALAEEANRVANAVNQHFWDDGNGAHVTEVTRDEWSDAGGSLHQSGINALWNSQGMLFRRALVNLLAIMAGNETGISIYDGNGNDPENIVASFSNAGIQLGSIASEAYLVATGDRISFMLDGGEVAYATGGEFAAPNMRVNSSLTFETMYGDWAWIPRNNGNLALKWMG